MLTLRFPGVTMVSPLPLLALYGLLSLLWVVLAALLVPRCPAWPSWARLAPYGLAMGAGPVGLWLLLILPQHWYWLQPV